eukprot:s553_g20.t1
MAAALDNLTETEALPESFQVGYFDVAVVLTIFSVLVGTYTVFGVLKRTLGWLVSCVKNLFSTHVARDSNPVMARLQQQVEELQAELDEERRRGRPAESQPIWHLQGNSLNQQLAERDRLVEERIQALENALAACQQDRARLENERNHYKERSRILINGPCFTTKRGNKWHCTMDCRTLKGSQPDRKETMCRFCAEWLQAETGDLMV